MFTKAGDRGITALAQSKNVSKSDDRLGLIGTLDELAGHLGVIKALSEENNTRDELSRIQRDLLLISKGISDPYSREYRIGDEHIQALEKCIDTQFIDAEQSSLTGQDQVLPGGSVLSARTDLARAVCRRAERALALVSVRYGADNGAKKYMNRLSDYLYALARKQDHTAAGPTGQPAGPSARAAGIRTAHSVQDYDQARIREAVVREVLARSGHAEAISLRSAKQLIEKLEQEAALRGMQAVIAVCGPHGDPVAVHVMDGAYLVSFDAAVKKAYTSVALRMSTQELSGLAQPGQTFYGVEHTDPRIVILGGGIPLIYNGRIIGGLGVSGGTSLQDHSLAVFGQALVEELL